MFAVSITTYISNAGSQLAFTVQAFFMPGHIMYHIWYPCTPVWSVNAPTVSHPSWTVICSATGQQDRLFCLLNIIIYNRKYFS